MLDLIYNNHCNLYKLFNSINSCNYTNLEFCKSVVAKKSSWPNFVFDFNNSISNSNIKSISNAITNNKLSDLLLINSNTNISDNDFKEYGFKKVTNWIGIAIELDKLDTSKINPELKVKIVTTENDIKNWIYIAKKQLQINFDFNELSELFKSDKITAFIGYYNNTAVSTMLLFLDDNIAGTHMGATLKEYSGKGFGSSIMIEALKYAKTKKYKVGTGAGTLKGINIWKNIGFTSYNTIDLYWKLPE